MKIICVEEHATDPATDKAARPAVLGEASYFGLMDSPRAASRPRNDHRPTMVALPLNHVWVTPSSLFDLPQFQFIHIVIGADRIIWSVDYPYLTLDGTREFLGKLPVSAWPHRRRDHRGIRATR
jgi:hypothetical protein